jgi:hypothetical protein
VANTSAVSLRAFLMSHLPSVGGCLCTAPKRGSTQKLALPLRCKKTGASAQM